MSHHNPLVRPAKPSDVHQLALLRESLWPESFAAHHAEELGAILSGNPPSTLPLIIFVSESPDGTGTLTGFLEAGLRSHADGCDPSHPVGYVEGWYVSAQHRRKGIGAALLQAAQEWARAQGCREMASDTQFTNELSQQVHQSLGFQIAERSILYRKSL